MSKIRLNNWTSARSGLTCLILFLFLTFPLSAFSWDGFDYDAGNYIEIDDSDRPIIKPGAIIQIYAYEDRDYHTVEIMSLYEANIEVYDEDMDEYRTFEMEGMEIRVKACMVQNNHSLA
ncbi:MAG: DUF5334 family protein [Syntrophus sp. (in: bacteria)]